MTYLGSNSYLGLKVEAVENTPVIPNAFCPLISESIKTNINYTADRRMKGIDFKSDDLLPGNKMHEGDIVVYPDADNLGHFLNMLMEKGSTTGSATGYTHPFTFGTAKSYTIEIQKGPYAQRFYGVKAKQIQGIFEDQKLKLTISVKAVGQFSGGQLKAALSGSVTELKLSSAFTSSPNKGLVVGDTICLQLDSGSYQDIVLTSVNADLETVGFEALSITAAANNLIYLKAQTPSYTSLGGILTQGNTLVGVAATSTLADTAAASKSTATSMYDFSFTLNNNLFDAPSTGNNQGPVKLIEQTKEAQLSISRIFEDVSQHVSWLNSIKQALTMIITGNTISGGTTKESLTIKFHKVKPMTNDEPLEVDSIIFDRQEMEALYDSSDAESIEISLVNKTAGTSY
jgi:hypothetical protein